MALRHHTAPRDENGELWPILAEMAVLPAWVVWKIVPQGEGKKPKKKPASPIDGIEKGWTGAGRQTDYATAIEFARARGYDGVGFLPRPEFGIVAIDLDHAIEGGKPAPWATAILAGSGKTDCYVERGPSKNGYHAFVRGIGNIDTNRNGVEVYDGQTLHYLTFTGDVLKSSKRSLVDGSEIIARAYSRAGIDQNALPKEPKHNTAAPGVPKNRFDYINQLALANLGAWFPSVFPQATQRSNGVYRLTPPDLGRTDRDVDGNAVSAHPDGIKDFYLGSRDTKRINAAGVEEQDTGGRTPLDMLLLKPYADFVADAYKNLDKPDQAAWVIAGLLGLPADLLAIYTPPKPKVGFVDIMLRCDAVMTPPAWPKGVLPNDLQELVKQTAANLCTTPAATAFAHRMALQIAVPQGMKFKPRGADFAFSQPANLYCMLIGEPGSAKTPLQSAAMRPFREASKAWAADIRREDARAAAEGKKPTGDGVEIASPGVPKGRRRRVGNTTVEAAIPLMMAYDEGLIVDIDEGKGFFAQMGQYSSSAGGAGSDESFYLESYGGDEMQRDRVRSGAAYAPEAMLSIFTGIQPEVFADRVATMGGDGFFQRFLYCPMGPPIIKRSAKPEDATLVATYSLAVNLLLELRQDHGRIEFVASKEAAAVWAAKDEWTRSEGSRPEVGKVAKAFYAKMGGLLARLTLGQHLITWAVAAATETIVNEALGEAVDIKAPPRAINVASVEQAWTLLYDFLLPNTLAVGGMIDQAASIEPAQKVGRWLQRERDASDPHIVKSREITTRFRAYRGREGQAEFWAVTDTLEHFGWLERAKNEAGVWNISPEIYSSGRRSN